MQMKEVGMLKLLLGHWKSHRKKPSLLPEDGDIRFEEPSRINPLFEDSDESTTSSKSPSELTPQNHTPGLSQVLNEETQNQTDDPVVNDLIDVFVPKITSDKLETAVQGTDTDIAAANLDTITEVTEGISSETNLKPVSEIAESVSEKTNKKIVLKEIESTTIIDSEETKISDAGKNKSSTSNKSQSDSGYVKDESTLNDQQSSQLEQPSKEKAATDFPPPPEDNTKVAEIKSADSMRIFEQPSISAIKHTKLSSDEAASEKITSQSSELKSAKIQTLNKSGNVQKHPENINGKNERNNYVSKTTKLNEQNSFSKPVQSNQQPVDVEKPAKLRTRAIDELIKKFQGSTSDSVTDKSSSDKKSLLNSPTEKSDESTNVAKTEKKPLPIRSEESIKETNKALTSEKKDITVTKPIQPNASKKSEIEKEALSNIFKFPPPPPIDKLQNESSLHGKIVKERKSAEILASSNVLTNNSKETEASKTRSDSSLDRIRTASSNKLETINEKKSHSDTNNKAKDSLNNQPIERLPSDNKKTRTKDLVTEQTSAKESKIEKETTQSKHLPEQKASTSSVDNVKSNLESVLNKTETKPPTGGLFVKKESLVSNSESKPQPQQENSSNLHKKPASGDQKKVSDFPVVKKKSSLSNKFPKDLVSNESENVRSHSEDSGITRGDQISSETTQEAAPVNGPAEETAPAQNPIRRSRKDKKQRSANKKPCKNCKRSHEDSASIKKSQYDAYYDGLAGIRHSHKRRHSDSMNSDLSWEEKELIRRLRSKRGTVRSNTPSTRSRNSRHRFIGEDHFRRHHNLRRSSDESSFYGGASLCSCDDCWVAYVKDYAYTRASLRGMPPIHEMCTCRSSRHNFLGRRVKFRSDPIQEASPSERTTETSTPAPSAENKQEADNETDDRSSQQSSRAKDDDSVLRHPAGIKEKKDKFPEESYRFVSPWELEEWDLVMRKELLKRRRRRARCMGIMALAMVVFVGLVVAILMVYLRRKII